jgi:hypothetical protein
MAVGNANVLLAHGAWTDGSSWAQVITELKSDGANVVAAPLPLLTSLADDVAALNRSIDRTEGPVVLVGHALKELRRGAPHSPGFRIFNLHEI